jgi:glycosyltransferase involved in cell wall biosynthesis
MMHICLLSTAYPPTNMEGIARQRQVLASELARQGHDVHVVTCGPVACKRQEQGVWVHQVNIRSINHYSDAYPNLDVPLTQSQALYEGLLQVLAEHPCDIVDVPLWLAQGFVTLQRSSVPTIVWLQTTTFQLLEINGNQPTSDDRRLIGLEQLCLKQAAGLLADSQAACTAVLHDYGIQPAVPTVVAHLGLPPLPEPLPDREGRSGVEALVVGRLERRKGTPLLFEVLPTLLRENPGLIVRFVGSDNSSYDGWHARYGMSYPEFFQRHYPDLRQQVIFEGYVDEERLMDCYYGADFLLAPSRYESFGLVYLEAMRTGLPVVTFTAGGAVEIFPDGEANGAMLIPPEDRAQLITAVSRLVRDRELRRQLGQRGMARFKDTFSAKAMADATVTFYKQVIASHVVHRPKVRLIYQVMEALDMGDAVSNITRRNAGLLAELGQPPRILTRYTHDQLRNETQPINQALVTPDCGLIFHYWAYNSSTWILRAVNGPKAIHYHNITPPRYFAPDTENYYQTVRGYEQLRHIADYFDLVIGDSRYNIAEFASYMSQPKPAIHLYPIIDVIGVRDAPYDRELLAALRSSGEPQIVFVGRIVRNKRQDQLMRLFDYYYREINHHARLWLVGHDTSDPAYRTELGQLRDSLAARERIMFTGKVSDLQVNTYYRAADVFICASEHEGFCMPLAQAMALDVPVLAYAAAAVPETMGDSGILIYTWDTPRVGELMQLMLTDEALRQRLLEGQRVNLERFSVAEARRRLAAIVNYLGSGESSPLFDQTSAGWSVEQSPSITIAV